MNISVVVFCLLWLSSVAANQLTLGPLARYCAPDSVRIDLNYGSGFPK